MKNIFQFAGDTLVVSCLNSRLESTALYWRRRYGLPDDYYGPFN